MLDLGFSLFRFSQFGDILMNSSTTPMETTGRYLVLLPDADISSGIRALTDATGISAFTRAADFEGHTFTAEQLESDGAKVFDTLGVAVVSLDPNQVQSVRAAVASERPVLAVEPERVVRAIWQSVEQSRLWW